MTEWRQERPPLADEHLAEIRERTKQGSILTWPEVDRAVLLAELDRVRAENERLQAGAKSLMKELDRLTRWKAEATPVLLGLQDLGRALGLPLGENITGPAAVEAATRLRVQNAEWQETATHALDVIDDLKRKVSSVEALASKLERRGAYVTGWQGQAAKEIRAALRGNDD